MSAMQRAIRSARALHQGPEILALMRESKTRRSLITAAGSGAPPVTAISTALIEMLGAKTAKLAPVKQFAGLCIRGVLEEEGFVVASKGVRVSNDPLFRTGTTYRKRSAAPTHCHSLLERLIWSFTDEEVEEVVEILRSRLNKSSLF